MIGLKKIVKSYLLPDSILITKIPHKKMLLTFDDGPDPDVTPKVLDLLAQYKAKAIFFIPGRRIERAPELLVEIIKQGHQIGNHTFIHSNGKQPGFFAYLRDIKKCQQIIFDTCGITPKFFRPPCGVLSLTTLLAPRIVGLRVMTWSLDVHDWKCRSKEDALAAAQTLIKNVKPGDIALLHDDNRNVVELLKASLTILVDNKLL